jgi:glycosyltransferase involved in cell wall biosynthesis
MKVCFVSHLATKGGAEKALLELVDALKEKGVKCYIILPKKGLLIDELEEKNIEYYVFPYRWWMEKKDSRLWKRIARIILNFIAIIPVSVKIKQWKCDVVCTNTITVCVGAFAARLLRLPHIWYIHEFGYDDHGLVFDIGSKLSLRLMDHLSTICIANSYAIAKNYQQFIKPFKVKVVYQSVNFPQNISTGEIIRKSKRGIMCIIVGALQEGKRQEEAILAIGELVNMGIDAKILIVGDGNPEYKNYLQKLVLKNELDRCVKFIGYVENPFSFIKIADILLMCSRNEAFGRVTVEAMKIGKPVIGARSGGTVELIRDGFNGFLYTPGDYKELATKIKYLYENPDIAQEMGYNGLLWAKERFTKKRYGDEVLTILQKLIKYKS